MKKNIITFVLIIVVSAMRAQQHSTNLTPEELATEKSVLVEKHPGVFEVEKIIAIRRLKPDLLMVDYTREGIYFEAFINSGTRNMLLVETDQLIPMDSVPSIVKAHALSGNYKYWQIDKVFKVSTPYGASLYRVDVYKNKDHKESVARLYFDDEGEFHQEPPK